MADEVQIVCNQEYYVSKIYGCNDFKHKVEALGFEVGKKIVPLKYDAAGRCELKVEGAKRSCVVPKSYFYNISLVDASDPQCQERIIEELDSLRISLFQTKDSYPTGLFGKESAFNFENYHVNVTALPPVDYIYGSDYANKRFRNMVLAEKTDVFVSVVDFHKLETELIPIVQLMDLGVKIVLVIRGYCDENEEGQHVDLDKMSKYMGIPVVLYNETDETGESRENVLRTILSAYAGDNPDMRYVHVNYGRQVERHIRRIQHTLESKKGYDFNASSRYMAISLMEEDTIVHSFNSPCRSCNTVKCFVNGHSAILGKQYDNHVYYVLKQARRSYIDGLMSRVTGVRKQQWDSERADSVLMHKVWGFPLFLLFMAALFCATFELGRFPMQWITSGMDSLSASLLGAMPDGAFGSFVANGLVGGIGAVLALLPYIMIFYLLAGLLENSGYMTRAAYCTDGFLRKLGLQGRSLVPMVLGFGCSVPAILSARNIESRSDRIVASLAIPFLPCAARMLVCLLIVAVAFPKFPALVMFVVYLVGMLLAIAFAKICSKTLCKQTEYPYVMELPSYRRPTLLMSLSYMWDRTWEFLKRISGMVVLGSIVIWALMYFPQNSSSNEAGSEVAVQPSYLESFGNFVEPVFRPAGFDWKMTVAAVSGIAGKELTLGTMSILDDKDTLSAESAEEENAEGSAAALAFVFFVLICFPCLGATSAIRKVSGFKWAALSVGVSLVLAWLVAFGIYQIGILL